MARAPVKTSSKPGASKPGTAVQTQRGGALATTDLMGEMQKDAGKGLAIGVQAYAIPFIGILEPLSPQLVRTNPAYVKGSEQGQIINSVTGEIFEGADDKEGSGILVVPCAYQAKALEWKPDRGGLVQIHEADTQLWSRTTQDENGRSRLPNGNSLVLTAHHYVLHLLEDGKIEQAVIAMSSTRFKCSKKWNTLIAHMEMDTVNGPIVMPSFANVWRLQTQAQQDGDKSWCIWTMHHEKQVDDIMIYRRGKTFSEAVLKGEIQAKPVEEGDGLSGARPSGNTGDHI